MTVTEITEYYANLLIIQYIGKSKAYETIKTLVRPVIMDQMPIAVQDAFEIGTAVGVQLDTLGKYVGVKRTGYGVTGKAIPLNDADYTTLIKMVLVKNNAGSSLATIQSLLSASFPGQVFISDNQTMSINYVLVESVGTSDLLEILTTGKYLPAPMGVGISVTVVSSHTSPYFGLRTYSAPDYSVGPFNNYDFYLLTTHWFSYGDAI